jgi:hypothetical protein
MCRKILPVIHTRVRLKRKFTACSNACAISSFKASFYQTDTHSDLQKA